MAKQKVEIGQLSVDYQELQGQLKTAETMVKTLKSNLRDLSNVKIDENGQVVGGFRALNTELDVTNKQMKAGKDLFRDFYKEQRIQDRTTREATQAVVGFTVGLAALVNNTEEGEKSTKRWTNSLLVGVTAMQAAEFSVTALGIATRNFTGILGRASVFLRTNAGAIAAIIGIGAALIEFFVKARQESKKFADEGLKKEAEQAKAAREEIEKLIAARRGARYNVGSLSPQDYLAQIENEKQRLISSAIVETGSKSGLENLIKYKGFENVDIEKYALSDEKKKILLQYQADYIALMKEQKQVEKEIQNQKDSERKKDEDSRKKRKEEYEKRLMSLADQRRRAAIEGRAKEYDENEKLVDQELEKVKLQYQLHSISLDDAIAQLQALEAQTNEADKRLKIEAMIADLRERDAQLQMQRMNEQLDQASRIATLLQRAFSKSGDDFIAKLSQALQIAINIAKIMNKNQGNNLGFADYLEIGLNVASLFGGGIPMFAKGGELTRPQIRLAGEAGPEFYMPKRTFYDVARMEIIPKMLSMAKRDLVRSTTIINNNSTTSAIKIDVSELKNEITSLGDRISLIATAIENMPAPTVAVHNPVTLGEALKREMPVYEKFKSEKFIDQ